MIASVVRNQRRHNPFEIVLDGIIARVMDLAVAKKDLR